MKGSIEKRLANLEEKVEALMEQVFPYNNKYKVHRLFLCEKCGKPTWKLGKIKDKDMCKCKEKRK